MTDSTPTVAEAIDQSLVPEEVGGWVWPTKGHNSLPRIDWRTVDLMTAVLFVALWRAAIEILKTNRELVPEWLVVVVGAVFPLLFVGLFPVWAWHKGGGRRPVHLPSAKRCLLEVLLAFPVMLLAATGMFVVSLLWQLVTAEPPQMDDRVRGIVFSRNPWLLGMFTLAACVWAPIAEELFFRGFLQNALARRTPVFAAAVLQTLLFAFVHPYSGMQLIGVLLIGGILTAHYLWRKTLIATICLHGLFNGLMLLLGAVLMLAASRAPVLGVELDPEATRCRVVGVFEGSAADEAGLIADDVIVSLNGQPMPNGAALQMEMLQHQSGEVVTLEVEREGLLLNLEASLQERTEPRP